MPPKRKASNDANHADAAEIGASPTPRKKTKAEAKAAAREWAENRRKKSAPATASASASVSLGESVLRNAPNGTADEKIPAISGTTSPTPRKKSKAEALAPARAWHDSRNRQTTASSVGVSSPPPPTTNKTQKTDHVTRSSGGNAFLQSVRTEVVTGVATKKEDPPSAVPESIQPTSSSALEDRSSRAPSPSIVAPSKPKYTLKSYVGKILRFLLFSLGLTLNVVAIVGIVQHQSSSYDEFERQNQSDMTKLSAAVSKSMELEAVLRSGVLVLEEKVQRMRQTVRIGNEGGEHALQYVQTEEDDDADRSVREERQNLQDALSILEEQLRDDQLH